MAIKWSQVSQKPEFLALSPEEQEETRQLYFDEVLSPQVDPADLDFARQTFDEDTRIMPQEEAPVREPGFWDRFMQYASPRIPDPEEGAEGLRGAGEMVAGTGRGVSSGAGAVVPSTMAAAMAAGQKAVGEEADPTRVLTTPSVWSAILPPVVGPAMAYGVAHVRKALQERGAPEALEVTRQEYQAEVQAMMPQELKERSFEENMADPTTAGTQAAWSVMSNLGPTGVTIGAGLAGGAVAGPLGGIAAAGGIAYALESGQSYVELKEAGAPEREAQALSNAIGVVNAALEIAPLGHAAKNIPGIRKLIKAKVTDLVKETPVLAAQMMAAEGGTEAIQQVMGNASKRVYDENQTLLEGTTEAAFVGAVLGGTIGGAGAVIPTPKPVRTAADVQSESDQAKFDLAEDLHENVLPDPKRILQQSQTATIKEREASIKTEGTAQVDALEAELEDPAPTPLQTEVEVEEIEAAPAPPVSYEEMRAMTVDEAMATLTEGHDAGTLRMTPDEFNALVDDIKENGIREPITLETGVRPGQLTLTDGRHRLLAAKAAGLKAVPVQVDPQETTVGAAPVGEDAADIGMTGRAGEPTPAPAAKAKGPTVEEMPTPKTKALVESDRYDISVERGDNGRLSLTYTMKGTEGWAQVSPVLRDADTGQEWVRAPEQYNPEVADAVEHRDKYGSRYSYKLKEGYEQEVPQTKGLMYRGMSAEEWANIQATGQIKSTGGLNLGTNQVGLTYYSSEASAASHYASGFAPVEYMATPEKPAVVIAVPIRKGVEVEGTGEHEIGIGESIPSSEIVEVWEGTPYTQSKPGEMDVVDDMMGVRDGSSYGISSAIAWKPAQKSQEVEEIEASPAPTPSANEIARPATKRGRLAAKYKEIGGKRDPKTKGWTFRSVDRKRVERAEKIFGESDVEAQPDVVGSFQTYVRDRGLDKTKLSRDEMKAIRSDYRTSLASQRPQVQTTPSDLTTKDSPMDNLRYLFQDKFIDLKRIEEVAGPGRAKPYRAETLHSGRAVSRVDDVETNIVDPLTSILAEHKIELQDLNDYMHALHAQEANAELQRRNPDRKDNDALSGMSNANAATVVSNLGGQKGMQDAAQYVRDMNDATADIIEAEGLEPGDVVQGWRDTYSNYVPLHRAGKQSLAGKGKGFSIRGRETRGRVGSESQVVDIIGHSVQNHARAIQRAEKNRVGLEVLNFARENPDSNFWTVDPVESVARFNPDTGLVETVADPTYQTKPNVFEVKEDGKTHHITFNPDNPKAVRLAESLNGLDADQMNSGLQALRTINQYLSAVNTTYNPEFMLGNFFRDVQTAGIKMEATEIQGMQVEVAKAIPEAMKTVYRSERGKTPKTEMQKYHEEWRQAGGKTGWVDAHATVESRVKELQGIINQKRGENKVRDVYKWTTGWMKDANSAVENAVRLSAYIAARKRGVSVEDAAVLSKELTVNFNRKGAWGPAFNAAWLFYNASVQGSANVLGAVASSKRVQKLVTGIAVGAFANALLQREIGGEDEDGVPYWDKIGAWEKERNLIIMNPFDDEGDYFKIPLPYGFNVFKVFGEVTADAIVRPDFNGIEAAGHVASAVVGAFNPVGSDASFLQFIAPTVLDPLVQISENKQFYGAPVMPENRFGPDKANAELYFKSARETSVKAAKALNELTGGHKYKSGYVDVSPEWIDLTVDFVTGGAGRTVADTSGTIVDVLTGEIEDRPLRRTPALRKFYSASPETWTPTTYFDYKHDITAFEAAYKDAVKSKQDRSSFRQDPRRSLIDRLKGAESLLREGYKARGEIEAKKPEGWEEKVERIEERIEKIRKRFIMMYREEMFPTDD